MGRPSDARQRLIAAAKEVIYAHSYEAVVVKDYIPRMPFVVSRLISRASPGARSRPRACRPVRRRARASTAASAQAG